MRFLAAGKIKLSRFTQCGDQFFMNDLDDLLTGLEALGNFRANRPLFNPFDEILNDRQGNIGLKQCNTNLAHNGVNVFFR